MGQIADQVRKLENRVESLEGNIEILRKSDATTGEAIAHMVLRDYWLQLAEEIEKCGLIEDDDISDSGLSDEQIIETLLQSIHDAKILVAISASVATFRDALKALHDASLKSAWAETEHPGEEIEKNAVIEYLKALNNAKKLLG